MDILDNAVNKRIMSGNFPADKLFPATIEKGREIDFMAQASDGLEVLRQNPELFYAFFAAFSKRVQELDSLERPECYIQGVNYLINAKCSDDYLLANGSLQTAFNLCPVITPLDKVLWYGAYSFYMEIELNQDAAQKETTSMMFAWVHLLDIAQKWEMKSGRTIETSAVKPSTRIFDIISGAYEERRFLGCSRKLIKDEYAGLRALSNSRRELLSEIQEEIRVAEDISQKTEKEWAIFLQVINDLSERESAVICRISEAISAKDKIRAIQEYNSVLRNIERGHYFLNGSEIKLIPLLEAVDERVNKASTFAAACTGEGIPFRVHPALITLVIDPSTYNYLFISFHHFRLEPSKETAKRFVSLALTCIKRNLGGEDHDWISLNDMIEDFYSTVFSFMNENCATIKNLSFDKLLTDVVAVDGSLESTETSEMYKESWAAKIRAYINSETYEKDIENFVLGKTPALGTKDILSQVSEAEAEIVQLESEASARRIIVSLNIIYMFCDALRIMLSSKRGNIKIKSPDTVEKYRRDLLKLDDELVHTVYAHLDEKEIGMLEYREKSGVFSYTLSEQEVQEEAYRNSLFSDILKRSVESLATGIETQDVAQIIETNSQIRAEILRYPDCDEKEYYANWLDSISGRICSALVENCKKQKDDYQAIKQNILTSLGSKSSILPASTIDSLTTAEMLYARYASDEYAREGFDYSCISALYYQAFEDAYNDLIWRGYATMLNNLVINGVNYTDILLSCKGTPITTTDAKGYLDDNNAKQRDYYVKYKYRGRTIIQATVDLRCMYKSFAIIMKNIINPSKLNGFCEYFAKLAGFSGRVEMFRNTPFMKKCCDFALAIDQSADNRNNASHGGSFISMQQCSDDKKTVLNNLEKVRSSSIGLVQQLLYLLQKD